MPPSTKFEGEHQRRRWSMYLGQFVGSGKLTSTALARELGGGIAPSRVSEWLQGLRAPSSETAWDVGRTLRSVGAQTNEVEALWAAGFFTDLLRLIHLVADDSKDQGSASAKRLACVLPGRMLPFELELMRDVAAPSYGSRYAADFSHIIDGGSPFTEIPAGVRASERITIALAEVFSEERLKQYERAYTAVSRGDRPSGQVFPEKGKWSIRAALRGDDDLINIIADIANRLRSTWVPSLLVVRLWRLLNEWLYDIGADSNDLDLLPDLFLPVAAQRERAMYLDDYYRECAYDGQR